VPNTPKIVVPSTSTGDDDVASGEVAGSAWACTDIFGGRGGLDPLALLEQMEQGYDEHRGAAELPGVPAARGVGPDKAAWQPFQVLRQQRRAGGERTERC
jgi:hypothetical protein